MRELDKKEEIKWINQTHGFDSTKMINITISKPYTPYVIYFFDQDNAGVLEPHNDSVITEANIQG